MKVKRILFLALILTMAAVVVSCAAEEPTGSYGAPPPPLEIVGDGDDYLLDENGEVEWGPADWDDLPDDLDFGGHEFHIWTRRNSTFYQYIVEELTGEILNDAVFMRARNVEERLNVQFLETIYTDNNAPRRILLAGDNTYDMINARCSHAFTYWLEGLIVDVHDLPFINLEKNYWHDVANDSIRINHRQHVAIGAANLTFYDFAHAMLFNKQMIQDLGLPIPFDLVRSGQWTLDAMESMVRAAADSMNAEGVWDMNSIFGYVSRGAQSMPNFWIASGLRSVSKDEYDIPYLSVDNERFLSLFNRVFEILIDTNGWFREYGGGGNVADTSIDLFMNNQSLFMNAQMWYISRLRGMETDFGIIPYPKFDESQEQHFARASFYDAFIVSQSNPDLARTSAIIEALNSESWKTVMPVYTELLLMSRYARDDESEAMLRMIMDNLVLDLGDTIWVDRVRDAVFAPMLAANNRNIVSRIDAMGNSLQRDIDRILDMD